MVLDPKRLLDLLSIAESGSFTKAAAARRVSQPALSNSMAVLEKALGVRVLERSRSGAVLTDYGRLLATHAQALTNLLARASEDVRLKKQGLEGAWGSAHRRWPAWSWSPMRWRRSDANPQYTGADMSAPTTSSCVGCGRAP